MGRGKIQELFSSSHTVGGIHADAIVRPKKRAARKKRYAAGEPVDDKAPTRRANPGELDAPKQVGLVDALAGFFHRVYGQQAPAQKPKQATPAPRVEKVVEPPRSPSIPDQLRHHFRFAKEVTPHQGKKLSVYVIYRNGKPVSTTSMLDHHQSFSIPDGHRFVLHSTWENGKPIVGKEQVEKFQRIYNHDRKRRYAAQPQRPVAPTFYSQAERVLNDRKTPVRATPEQFRNILLKQGVKPEEMEWGGLLDHLTNAKGLVTRDELLNTLKHNDVQLHEVMRGGSEPEEPDIHWHERGWETEEDPGYEDEETGEWVYPDNEDAPIYRDLHVGDYPARGSNTYRVHYDHDAGNLYITDPDGNEVPHDYEPNSIGGSSRRGSIGNAELYAEQAILDHHKVKSIQNNFDGPTVHHNPELQLPGADQDTYRELLLTLPNRAKPVRAEATPIGYQVYDSNGDAYGTYSARSPEEALQRAREVGRADSHDKSATFQHGH